MLTMLFCTDWVAGRNAILERIAGNVRQEKEGCILLVPELVSHDMERRMCKTAGNCTSRFAEVLSFTRLSRRVSEYLNMPIPECLDNGGRIVAMAAATLQLHSKLKAYASLETNPEFLCELVDAIDELKCCCISSADLYAAAAQTTGSLAQKTEELALIYDAYDAICQQGKRDPRDQMSWLLDELEASDFAQKHYFYVDGFPDFTRQHMLILEHFIASNADITISMNCDCANSSNPAYEKAGETAAHLLQFAERSGVPVVCQEIISDNSMCADIGALLFGGKIIDGAYKNKVETFRTADIYDECCLTVDRILELAVSGSRYRDISIVCTDIDSYKNTLGMLLRRCNIPFYLSGTDEIIDKSILNTVFCALDAINSGFDQAHVLRYLKSLLSPLSQEACDKLENYVILWSISGRKWTEPWVNHPFELGGQWNSAATVALEALNDSRRKAMDPLMRLRNNITNSVCLKDQVQALYVFLEEIQFPEALEKLSAMFNKAGDNREAQIADQVWDILVNALEQLHDMLGQTSWSIDTFVRLFKLLLSQYDVGTIPSVLDAVTVGPVSAMRCHETKYLFVLGALEGTLPGFSATSGILNDQDRTSLRKLGLPVNGGSADNLQVDYAEICGVFTGARESAVISCPGGQPSYVFQRLAKMAGGLTEQGRGYGAVLTSKWEAAAYFAQSDDFQSAQRLLIFNEYRQILSHRDHKIGTIQDENIRGLYGNSLMLSASQIDKQADCRMEYFCKYGLRLKERKSASVDPSEFGTYVHDVLENTAKKVMELGGFRAVTLEEITDIAISFSDAYAAARFSELDSERLAYLFRRNAYELKLVVKELWQEMQQSDFIPIGFEVGFGKDKQMPAVCVSGKKMEAYLGGFVDRVDIWKTPYNQYFRVVDYKTGRKSFDYCDVINGVGLQMLLYLFALEDNGKQLLGETPICAGVQYFPARIELYTAEGMLSDEEVETVRISQMTRKGLILGDEDVLHAMDNSDTYTRLACKRLKNGALTGDLADSEGFRLLKRYVFLLVGRIVDDIASGNVEPNPYTRGSYHNPCTYCPYGMICHKESVEGRRNFKAVKATQFWEEIRKEVGCHG